MLLGDEISMLGFAVKPRPLGLFIFISFLLETDPICCLPAKLLSEGLLSFLKQFSFPLMFELFLL
jgi:hypothetical protein